MNRKYLLFLSFVTLCGVFVFGGDGPEAARSRGFAPNEHIDPAGHLANLKEASKLRESHRLSESDFWEKSQLDNAVVLDARSAPMFALRHVEGAVNLPFSEFTTDALAQVIPSRDTPVLIYCNNNFGGDPQSMRLKRVSASLNLSTYAALHDYEYMNVWELGPYTAVQDSTLPMVGELVTVYRSRGDRVAAQTRSERVKLHLDVDRPMLPARSEETVILKIALNGIARPSSYRTPLNLALVIDRSGSMAGDKLRQAKLAAHEAVDRLASYDVVSLVVYGTEAVVLRPANEVGDGRSLHRAIDRISTSGNTNLFGGVELAARELQERLRQDFVHRVILLSDGLANVGPSTPFELGGLGRELRAEGMTVSTLGLGLGYNEDLMAALARRSDGNTYFVENSADLPYVFATEFGDAMNVVARELVVEVTFPEGVTPVRIVGRDGKVYAQRAQIEMNQLYGGREQFALIEVRVEPGRRGESRKLAQAWLSYREEADAPRVRIGGDMRIGFTDEMKVVRENANHRVQTDFSLNRLAEVKERVIELHDAGRKDEARLELSSLASAQRKMSASYGNVSVGALADQVEEEAELLRSRGLDNASRKSYRADSLQISRQQKRD